MTETSDKGKIIPLNKNAVEDKPATTPEETQVDTQTEKEFVPQSAKTRAKELVTWYVEIGFQMFKARSKQFGKVCATRAVDEILHHYRWHNKEFRNNPVFQLKNNGAIELPIAYWIEVKDAIYMY